MFRERVWNLPLGTPMLWGYFCQVLQVNLNEAHEKVEFFDATLVCLRGHIKISFHIFHGCKTIPRSTPFY